MKRIKTIYGALSRTQKKALKGYLGLFGNSKGEDKQVTLLKLMDKNSTLSYEEAAQKLYGDPKSKAFSMMKGRLYERMTEFLTTSLNPERAKVDKEMPYFRDLIAYRREMSVATVLQEMRLGIVAKDHFQHALQLARSCHNAELEADVLMRIRGTLQLQQLPYAQITEELHVALEATERDAHAIGIYHDFIQQNNLKTSGQQAMIDYLDEHLPNLELRVQQFYSARADYYVQILQVHRARLKRQYVQGKQAALKARQLLDDHSGLRSRQRFAEPSYQLAILELKFGKYREALDAFDEARKRLKQHSQSYFLLSAMMLYPLVYAGEYAQARELGHHLAELSAQEHFARHQRIQELADYLLACAAFREGKFKVAKRRLLAIESLNGDKAGWDVGLRLFEVLVLVELGEMETAELRVDALRKHLERHEASPREIVLLRLLRAQARQFFSFVPLAEEAELLRQLTDELPWDPVGHEVIQIDQWYSSKLEKATAH